MFAVLSGFCYGFGVYSSQYYGVLEDIMNFVKLQRWNCMYVYLLQQCFLFLVLLNQLLDEVNLSFVFGIVFGFSLAAVSFYLPEWLFSNSNSETFRIAHYMLLIYGLMYPFMILTSVTYAIIRTGGAVYSEMLMDSVFTWLIPLPILAGLIYGSKLDIIYIILILQLTDALKTIWSLILFNQKKWVKNLTSSINIPSKSLVNEEIEQIITK